MIVASHGIIGSSIGQVDADYLAILNYATTQGYTLPSASQRAKQNQLLVDLKDAGIWNELDTLGVFAGGSGGGDSNFSLIDWKRLSQMTNVNGCIFSGDGFTGDGIDSYINTNFNLLLDSSKYTQDNASKFGWISGTPTDNKAFDGCITPPPLFTFNNYNTSNIRSTSNQWRINTVNNASGATSGNTTGSNYLLHFFRDGAASSGYYKNTILSASGNTTASSTLLSNQQTIMAGQTSFNFSSLTISAYGMGSNLSSNNTNLYNAIDTYILSL